MLSTVEMQTKIRMHKRTMVKRGKNKDAALLD